MRQINIKELHENTGECVWRAGASRSPVAALANPSLLKSKRRRRVLLPEFKALMAKPSIGNSMDDLDAVRGDR